PVPIHCINGLETSCALASITWMLCFASGERRGWFPAAFLCGLTATFRPDLLPLAGLLALLLIWRMLRSSAGQGRPWGRTLALALVAAAPVLLCSFWYLHT